MQSAVVYERDASVRLLGTLSEEERLLAERFLRLRTRKELVFEFTRDKGYLHQYYLLREKNVVTLRRLNALTVLEEEADRHSHILVARRGNQVVAGGRLTISAPRRPMLLPIEGKGFHLAGKFPDLGLENKKYAEISRVAIEDEFRDDRSLPAILQHFHRKIIATRVEYLFGVASLGVIARYRRVAAAAALDMNIIRCLEFPESMVEEGIKSQLVMMPVILPEMRQDEAEMTTNAPEGVSIW